MTKKHFYFFVAAVLTAGILTAQSWKRRKADEYYYRYDFDKAISLYESLRDKDAEVYRRLAEAYWMRGDYDKAAAAYGEVIKQGGYGADDVYRYAYLLRMTGDYEGARKWMEVFARLRPRDSRAVRFRADPQYYKRLLEGDPDVSLKNVSVNGPYSDFGPAYYVNKYIVFTSSRGGMFKRVWGGNAQPYLDLYKAEITSDGDLTGLEPFYGEVNRKYHDGPASFNRSGDYMVLTRNIYDRKVKDNKLWLYESRKEAGGWTDPEPLPFNSPDYSCGHAALSPDGQSMYFVSDMPGGMGGTDLYYVEKDAEGRWGTPRHLGSSVNTEGNEMFPYFDTEKGYLFFASDGLPGLGGLDVFVSKRSADGSFGEPVNLGAPINTRFDDFALIFRDHKGYMSSNREGGKGDDDIYAYDHLRRFEEALKDYYLAGTVKSDEYGQAVEGAQVEVYAADSLVASLRSDASGRFAVKVRPGSYEVRASKEGYEPARARVEEGMFGDRDSVEVELVLSKPLVAEAPDICSVKIEPLYYDLDKWYIRPLDRKKLDQLIDFMKRHPEVKVEIASHTDSRASHAYNWELSRKRTMSVVNYLTSHGISRDRLVAKWYGETRLVNECRDGVSCPEWKHQLNRRSEFRILGCEEENRE